MEEEIYIVDEMQEVVTLVDAALYDEDNFPFHVNYMYGHPEEISLRLQKLTDGPLDYTKFPLIILLTDVTIVRNKPIGFYGSTNLRMLVVNITQPDYISTERTENNFKPILHPIKEELIKQIERHQLFSIDWVLQYKETDMYFYGSEINQKNVFNDYIDAIELRDIPLMIQNKICSPSNNF